METWIWVVLLLVLLTLLAWLWEHVIPPPPPPTITLGVSPTTVELGKQVVFSGTLMQGPNPLASKTVSLAVSPPSGDGYPLSAVTDASGVFSLTWTVPSGEVIGGWVVVASYIGAVSVEKTFTQSAANLEPPIYPSFISF